MIVKVTALYHGDNQNFKGKYKNRGSGAIEEHPLLNGDPALCDLSLAEKRKKYVKTN